MFVEDRPYSLALPSRVGNRPPLLGCEDEAIEWLKRHAD